MNSSLEHEFVNFEFAKHSDVDEKKPDILLNFGDEITLKKVEKSDKSCHQCEICEQQFSTKSELHKHYICHLGQPRVVLKRIPNVKLVKKKHCDSYQLEPEPTGGLKLKLKRQSSPSELKLTLKKSAVTKDFTIINTNSDIYNTEQVVAGKQENDTGDNAEETAQDLPSKDMTINDEENYGNENYDPNETTPLEEVQDRPSVDTNEGDSGVGSDMANPLEREDQNIEDSQNSDQYEPAEKTAEDDKDSEELEQTCRETIENLRRLGEQTSSPDGEQEPESVHEGGEASFASPVASPKPVEGPSFAWESVLEKDCEEPAVEDDSINHESLLQNFLMEQQSQNQTDPLATGPFETEYVSLEKLAETVSTCRVCSEKFKDIAQLDTHRSKMGHYQCNVPDCSSLLFNSTSEVSQHKAQLHGAPASPSGAMNVTSPHLRQMSPHSNSPNLPRNSPMSSPQQTNSPTFNHQQMLPPVNFDQLPAPVQQLAQQVQRMPLPQAQMAPSLPPGAATMIPGGNYFVPTPGRPPMYRISPQQPMHYTHMPQHMYPYGPPGTYPQMPGVPQMPGPQMHPPMPQQISRGRYPSAMVQQNVRAPRIVQNAMPRQRMKRPLNPSGQMQNSQLPKQRRMDVLLPDRNEDADCQLIAQQKRNDGIPVIQNVQGATSQAGRTDSTIHLTDSITLSVRQPAGQVQSQNNATVAKKPDASAVANVLAARGITVTPAANKNKLAASQEQQKQPQQQPASQQRAPPSVTALNLNSAISIIPASSQRKQQQEQQQQQFAVPQNAQKKTSQQNEVERPPRPPTVDLTQDGPPAPPLVRRGRPPSYLSRTMLACQICDKRFQTQELLTIHMSTHRTTNKLIHKCNLCPAQYPTLAALTTHKHTFHKELDPMLQHGTIELAIPVVDLKSPHVVNRLSNLGIQSYIPLSQLSSQAGGYFGLPIVNVEGARNPNTCNLGALGAMSILSLGPLKHLSNR